MYMFLISKSFVALYPSLMYWIRVFCQKVDSLRAIQCDSVPESSFVQKKQIKTARKPQCDQY